MLNYSYQKRNMEGMMIKSKSYSGLFSFIFLLLGGMFLIFGVLSHMGILSTSPDSVGDPKIWFPIIGGGGLLLGILFLILAKHWENQMKRLLTEGRPVRGQIQKVQYLFWTRSGRQHPYRVYFTYQVAAKQYKGKSFLLWEKPNVHEGDSISVYIEEEYPQKYGVEIKD